MVPIEIGGFTPCIPDSTSKCILFSLYGKRCVSHICGKFKNLTKSGKRTYEIYSTSELCDSYYIIFWLENDLLNLKRIPIYLLLELTVLPYFPLFVFFTPTLHNFKLFTLRGFHQNFPLISERSDFSAFLSLKGGLLQVLLSSSRLTRRELERIRMQPIRVSAETGSFKRTYAKKIALTGSRREIMLAL